VPLAAAPLCRAQHALPDEARQASDSSTHQAAPRQDARRREPGMVGPPQRWNAGDLDMAEYRRREMVSRSTSARPGLFAPSKDQ
jgi:Ni/Co efflux regulator RcnB